MWWWSVSTKAPRILAMDVMVFSGLGSVVRAARAIAGSGSTVVAVPRHLGHAPGGGAQWWEDSTARLAAVLRSGTRGMRSLSTRQRLTQALPAAGLSTPVSSRVLPRRLIWR